MLKIALSSCKSDILTKPTAIERTTQLVPKFGWLCSFFIYMYKHSKCSGNVQGNRGMAFGRIFRTNQGSYLFLGWSSSFEGSRDGAPLSLLACFFVKAIYLTDRNWLPPGLAGMLSCVEVDKEIICGDFRKFEQTSTVKRFSFRGETPIASKAIWKLACTLDYHQPRRKREGHL